MLQEPPQELRHALATDQAEAADAPAGNVAESHGAANAADFFRCRAARECRRDDCACAYAGDAVQRDLLALKYPKDSDMCNTAREPPAKREPDTRLTSDDCGSAPYRSAKPPAFAQYHVNPPGALRPEDGIPDAKVM